MPGEIVVVIFILGGSVLGGRVLGDSVQAGSIKQPANRAPRNRMLRVVLFISFPMIDGTLI
jgi:hypothetical protein